MSRTRTSGRRFQARPGWTVGLHRRMRGPIVSGMWRSDLQKKVGAGQDVSSELLEGAELIDAAARRARFGDARNALRAAALHVRDTHVQMTERVAAALDVQLHSLLDDNYSPPDLTAYARELEVWVDRERAAFASVVRALSALADAPIPASRHVSRRRRRRCRASRSWASTSCICRRFIRSARTFAKGRTTRSTPEPDDVGSPWAIGNEDGGHTAIEPALGTLDDFDALRRGGARARHGDRARLRAAVLARPSVGEGASRLVPHPARRHDQVRRESAEEVSGHLSAQLLVRRSRRSSGTRCRDVSLFWIEPRREDLSRRQSAHEAVRVLGVGDRRRAARRIPTSIFFAEAFTRPKRDEAAREARLHDVVHVLHVEEHAVGAARVLRGADADAGASSTSAATSSRTRRTSCTSIWQNGGRPAFRMRLLLAATLSPLYGIYSGFELCENVPVRAGQRGVSRLGEVSAPARATGTRRATSTPTSRASTRSGASSRRCSGCDNLTFHASENPTGPLLSRRRATPGGASDVLVDREPRSARRAGRKTVVHVPLAELGLDPDDAVRRARSAHRRALHVARRAQLRAARSRRAARHIFRRASADRAHRHVPYITDAAIDPHPMPTGAHDDPLWYKDAIIYQLHVKAIATRTPTASAIFRADREARLHPVSSA